MVLVRYISALSGSVVRVYRDDEYVRVMSILGRRGGISIFEECPLAFSQNVIWSITTITNYLYETLNGLTTNVVHKEDTMAAEATYDNLYSATQKLVERSTRCGKVDGKHAKLGCYTLMISIGGRGVDGRDHELKIVHDHAGGFWTSTVDGIFFENGDTPLEIVKDFEEEYKKDMEDNSNES